jgi:hypothetical protein
MATFDYSVCKDMHYGTRRYDHRCQACAEHCPIRREARARAAREPDRKRRKHGKRRRESREENDGAKR